MLEISDGDKQRRCSRQKPRKGNRLAVRRKEEWEEHHYENPESEATDTLYETRSNGKHQYKQ